MRELIKTSHLKRKYRICHETMRSIFKKLGLPVLRKLTLHQARDIILVWYLMKVPAKERDKLSAILAFKKEYRPSPKAKPVFKRREMKNRILGEKVSNGLAHNSDIE